MQRRWCHFLAACPIPSPRWSKGFEPSVSPPRVNCRNLPRLEIAGRLPAGGEGFELPVPVGPRTFVSTRFLPPGERLAAFNFKCERLMAAARSPRASGYGRKGERDGMSGSALGGRLAQGEREGLERALITGEKLCNADNGRFEVATLCNQRFFSWDYHPLKADSAGARPRDRETRRPDGEKRGSCGWSSNNRE
jgi:hypothetical protein